MKKGILQPDKRPKAPVVKICCIGSVDEALMAIKYGAQAVGLVGPMPSGPGVIDDEMIAEIAAEVPDGISSFLLTSETSAEAVIAHHRKVNTTTIQLVDALQDEAYDRLRQALPGIEIVQVIHVLNQASVQEAIRIAPQVDTILLDSGNPNASTKILGGTGKTHNWELSRQIRDVLEVPVFLAGGIRASNAREALSVVDPFGLDLCSSVRTKGKLDEEKLKEFFTALTH